MKYKRLLPAAAAAGCLCAFAAAPVRACAATIYDKPMLASGDANADKTTDSDDLSAMLRFISNYPDTSAIDLSAADVTGDGTVDIADCTRLSMELAQAYELEAAEDVTFRCGDVFVRPGGSFYLYFYLEAGRASGFQMEMHFDEALKYRSYYCRSFQPAINDTEAGRLRLAAADRSFTETDSTHALFRIKMLAPAAPGVYPISIEDCIFAGPDGEKAACTLKCGAVRVMQTLPAAVLTGDVNNDGAVDPEDLNTLRSYLYDADSAVPDDTGLLNADLDGDGCVTAADLRKLDNLLSGIPEETTTVQTNPRTAPSDNTGTTETTYGGERTTGSSYSYETIPEDITPTTTTVEETFTFSMETTTTAMETTTTAIETTTAAMETTTTTVQTTTTAMETMTTAMETTTTATETTAAAGPERFTAEADMQNPDENGSIIVEAGGVTAVLDADAVSILREQADSALLCVQPVTAEAAPEAASDAQKAAVQKVLENGGRAFDLSLADRTGNPLLFSDEEKGSVTVTVPFAASDPDADVKVYYLDESGSKTDMNGIYDEGSGTVTFRTAHFSLYVVEEVLPQTGTLSAFPALHILAAAVLTAAGACLVTVSGVCRRRRDQH